MTARVRFRPEAAADVADAHAWYERQRAGLGTEFEEAGDGTTLAVLTLEADDVRPLGRNDTFRVRTASGE